MKILIAAAMILVSAQAFAQNPLTALIHRHGCDLLAGVA